MLDPRQLEQPLSEQEQRLRDYYVAEYLKDFDSFKACIRMGFQAVFATEWSVRLHNDGYVQRKLQYMTTMPSSPEQEAADRALVETTLRTVMHRGSDSARVSAVGKFMELRGWAKPDPSAGGAEERAAVFRDLAQQLPT
jgi:hypothetical protein